MTIETRTIRGTVDRLIEVCRDGEQGYKTAAGAINNDGLKKELMLFSEQHGRLAADLSGAMERIGFAPYAHGSISGALHRGWINLIKFVPGDHEHAILAACEAGEGSAFEAYIKAMAAPLPDPLADLVSDQYEVVKDAHERTRRLRDAALRN